MQKYASLVKVLDRIRLEAPLQLQRYRPLDSDIIKIDQARAKAYIHLFLKVQFGLLDFQEREGFITDGANDGGIDAYYIDHETRKIYFIQSKFRTTSENFRHKHIDIDELLKMDVDRITNGKDRDEHNVRYSEKIQRLIKEIQAIDNIARWEMIVVILANLKPISSEKLKRVIGGFSYQIIDHARCYSDLLFPIISGTYYNATDLTITINLPNSDFAASRISYPVETDEIDCEISVVFVPTIEIAKVLLKYKNSILHYNPRSFLSLSNNAVNSDIKSTLVEKEKNEFALYNNGITMLSDDTAFTDKTGRLRVGKLSVKNPQILNGGQTAYTLNQVYGQLVDEGRDPSEVFKLKEVMLKVITITEAENLDEAKRLNLIEAISKATNQQSPVNEADRRSNDKVQVELQRRIFDDFGYFYERKKGEFFDGLKSHYIDSSLIINRELLARLAYAISGDPVKARRNAVTQLFSRASFDTIYTSSAIYKDLFFAYLSYQHLDELAQEQRKDKQDTHGFVKYGYALLYGRFAVVYVAHASLASKITPENVKDLSGTANHDALKKWAAFENYAKSRRENKTYFYENYDPIKQETQLVLDFANYYKGSTVRKDLAEFFKL